MRQFVDEFNINVNDLDDIDDYAENISVLERLSGPAAGGDPPEHQPVCLSGDDAAAFQRRSFAGLRANVQLLYGILLHMTNYLSRIEHGNRARCAGLRHPGDLS
ncbi:MAG: hypothetical protein ACLVJ6_13205 [Merdibacter sp.]